MTLYTYCKDNGFDFDDDCLFNFHCSLQSKPFVILYGPSGTGKSKIAEIYAEYICSVRNLELKDHLCFIPVRPNWTSPTDLMGFYDYLNGKFIPSEFYNFLELAQKSPEKPYFLILDEMNLSVVEHYFSDFLSCLESRRLIAGKKIVNWEDEIISEGSITLSHAIILAFYSLVESGELKEFDKFEFSKLRNNKIVTDWKRKNFKGQDDSWLPQFRTEFNQKNSAGENSRLAGKFFDGDNGTYKKRNSLPTDIIATSNKIHEIAKNIVGNKFTIFQHEMTVYKTETEIKKIAIPLNLYVIGTINMDESTHSLSPKVLDRANIIEMNNVSITVLSNNSPIKTEMKVSHIDTNFSSITGIATIKNAKYLNEKNSALVGLMYDINDKLIPYRTNLGHRSIFEMLYYIFNYTAILGDEYSEEALDYQLSQKLIPKLMGADERVEQSIIICLESLLKKDIDKNIIITEEIDLDINFPYKKTVTKLIRMYRYFIINGYVNFANV